MLRNIENQQGSSDLSLVNEKLRLRNPQQITFAMLNRLSYKRGMNFWSRDSHSNLLFKSNHISKLEDKILKYREYTFYHQIIQQPFSSI